MDPEAAEMEAAETERLRLAALERGRYTESLMSKKIEPSVQFVIPVMTLTWGEFRAGICKARIHAGAGCCGACCYGTGKCPCHGIRPCLDCKGDGVCPGCD